MNERDDQERIQQQLSRLPYITRLVVLDNIAEHLSWHGDVSREWLENEINAQYERKGMKV